MPRRTLLPVCSSLAVGALIVACGGDGGPTGAEPVDTTPPPPPSVRPRTVEAHDIGNQGSAGDLEVRFQRARDHLQVTAYRILVEPAPAALTVSEALALGPDRYREVEVPSEGARVVLDGLTATDGSPVVEGEDYAVRVLGVAAQADSLSQLSTAASARLADAAVVRTLGPGVVGGTGGLAIAGDGTVFMADFVSTVYRIAPGGEPEVFSEGHATPSGNLVLADGSLLQSNYADGSIDRIAPDGTVSPYVEGLVGPVGMTLAPDGAVLVVDCNVNEVRRVADDGTFTTFAESPLLLCPNSITTDGSGTFWVVNFRDGAVLEVNDAGDVSVLARVPGTNNGHIVHHDGALWLTSLETRRIYRVTLDGSVEAVAGSGAIGMSDGLALEAEMARPNGIVIDAEGRFLYWNDHFGDALNAYADGPAVLRRLEFAREGG